MVSPVLVHTVPLNHSASDVVNDSSVSGTTVKDALNNLTASVTADVTGPASATDNAVARFDGTTGKLIQDTTGVTIDDTNNVTVAATQGTELAPALTTGNWTLGTGWTFGTSPNRLLKSSDGTGSAVPVTGSIVSGTTYKVVMTISGVSGGSSNYATLGGTYFVNAINNNTTITEYITTVSTQKLTITTASSTSRFTISAVSITAITNATGDLTVDGNLIVKSPSTFYAPAGFYEPSILARYRGFDSVARLDFAYGNIRTNAYNSESDGALTIEHVSENSIALGPDDISLNSTGNIIFVNSGVVAFDSGVEFSGTTKFFGYVHAGVTRFIDNENLHFGTAGSATTNIAGDVTIVYSGTSWFFSVLEATQSIWFNSANVDCDFIYETLNNTDTFFIDAGNDRVGIHTPTPAHLLDVNGMINTPGTSGNTYRWNAASTAPTTTLTPTFTSYYGGNTNALGDPTIWVLVNINGNNYKVPAYT